MLPPRTPKRKARNRPEPIALRIVLSLTRSTPAASRMVEQAWGWCGPTASGKRPSGRELPVTAYWRTKWANATRRIEDAARLVRRLGEGAELGHCAEGCMIGNEQKTDHKARGRLWPFVTYYSI